MFKFSDEKLRQVAVVLVCWTFGFGLIIYGVNVIVEVARAPDFTAEKVFTLVGLMIIPVAGVAALLFSFLWMLS